MNQNRKIAILAIFWLVVLVACGPVQQTSSRSSNSNPRMPLTAQTDPNDTLIFSLLNKHPQLFSSVLENIDKLAVQVIYTQLDRTRNGKPRFTDHFFNIDTNRYFYPASTVKLPIAILALQKLNELKIPGLDRNSTMITEAGFDGQTPVFADASAPDGRPSIAHYIKKIFLVSDNDAYNRLYEFLGQEYINNSLHQMGYTDVQIVHRLEISMTEEQNRHTNPIKFYDTTGKLVYEKPMQKSGLIYASRDTRMGKGFYRGGELVNGPFDFSKKNRISLPDLHLILRSIIFPDAVPPMQRFNLTKDDYDFLRKYMSMWPSESKHPYYDPKEYPDTYVKFILYGAEKVNVDPGIRIFNKPGDAYGFMLDIVYIADMKNSIECMVSAVIHCNSDEIFNDNKYEYNTVGYPFMKNLGRVIYDHERNRVKKFPADLSSFQFRYE